MSEELSNIVGSEEEKRDAPEGEKRKIKSPSYEFRPLEKPNGGRPSMFENPRVMALLESAYTMDCTHEEAAKNAGLPSQHSLMYHIKEKTMLRIFKDGEDTGEMIEFIDLIDLWRANMGLAAKHTIYSRIVRGEGQDAWRYLERTQRRWALQKGQGSVDGGSTIAVDLGAEAKARLEKYQEPETESTIHSVPRQEDSQTASIVDIPENSPPTL